MRRILPVYVLLFLFLFRAGTIQADNTFYVRWVNDGDTVVLGDGRRLRYIGINAPEVEHKDQKAEPYGKAAKNLNKRLVFKKSVLLEFDREKTDHYGRLLGYVFLADGVFVNQSILKQGYAYFLYRRPNLKYEKVLLEAQRNAMRAKRGIWSDWRDNKRRYLGNKKSKRFHLPTCPFGKKTARRNRIYFSTKWDAFWAGYAPARKCFTEIRLKNGSN